MKNGYHPVSYSGRYIITKKMNEMDTGLYEILFMTILGLAGCNLITDLIAGDNLLSLYKYNDEHCESQAV